MMEKLDKLAIKIYNWVIITVVSIVVFILFNAYSEEKYMYKDVREKVTFHLLGKDNV